MRLNPGRLKKSLHRLAFIFIFVVISAVLSQAQSVDSYNEQEAVNPRNALLRSLVMPGWGHYYVDQQNWRRGQYHLAAEVVLITSFLVFRTHSQSLEQNMYTVASAHSGTDISSRDRRFQLAVGNYHSLEDHNDYQQRSRNLDRLFPDTPEYHWEWDSRESRFEYRDIRSRWDNTNQQLPALVTLMVVNRVISGLSAFTRARNHNNNLPEISLSYNSDLLGSVQANLSVGW